jgi:hypothetical protein
MGPGFIFKNWAHEVSLPWGVPVIKVYIYIYIYIYKDAHIFNLSNMKMFRILIHMPFFQFLYRKLLNS